MTNEYPVFDISPETVSKMAIAEEIRYLTMAVRTLQVGMANQIDGIRQLIEGKVKPPKRRKYKKGDKFKDRVEEEMRKFTEGFSYKPKKESQ